MGDPGPRPESRAVADERRGGLCRRAAAGPRQNGRVWGTGSEEWDRGGGGAARGQARERRGSETGLRSSEEMRPGRGARDSEKSRGAASREV